MASQFQDLAEMWDPNLPLPIRGKTYSVPSPNIAVGLRAQATVAIAVKVKAGGSVTPEDVAALKLDDEQELEFTQSMLGPVFTEMQADDIPWEYVRHAAKTVFMWLISDRDEAAQIWADRGADVRDLDRRQHRRRRDQQRGSRLQPQR